MGATYFLLLSSLGLVITTQAQDCIKPVRGENMDLKDEDILSETFPNGTRVSFKCNVGYVSAGGSASITCNAGIWSPVLLKCKRRSCGSAGDVLNGQVDYPDLPEGNLFGDKLVVTCNDGHRLVGDRQRTCGAQGWLGRFPVCEVVTCNPPPSVDKAIFSPNKESYNYRDVVQYTCQNDYTLSGSKSISCSNDETFHPAPPTCVMVLCEDHEITNGEWLGGSRPPYRHKATVTYKCRPGFTMIGSPSSTCGIDSQWSPPLPTCQPVTCNPPPSVDKATLSPNKESYNYRDVVQYTCQNDYILSGSKSISCSDDGTFHPAPPTCIMIQCEGRDIVNADRVQGSQPPYRPKSTVTYKCRSGFTMIGAPTVTCGIDSQWSPPLPTCQRTSTTTTTTATTTTTKPPPGNNGDRLSIGLGVGLTVLIVALTACGCYFFGVPAFIKKKTRSGRGYPDNPAPKDGEEVALS